MNIELSKGGARGETNICIIVAISVFGEVMAHFSTPHFAMPGTGKTMPAIFIHGGGQLKILNKAAILSISKEVKWWQ